MRVLIACEYSGTVRDAFIAKGHDAISCDLLPTDIPGPHIQGDVINHLNQVGDGYYDLMIAHPPCTYLTGAAEWAFDNVPMIKGKPRKMKIGTLIGAERRQARIEALDFIELLWNAPIKRICIENPVGIINSRLDFMPKPQYVQQHWFGEDASKKTGLWLKGLPELVATNRIEPRWVCGCSYVMSNDDYNSLGKYGCPNCCGDHTPKPRWGNQTDSGQNKLPPSDDRWKIRSTTPQGLANAMAEQWG